MRCGRAPARAARRALPGPAAGPTSNCQDNIGFYQARFGPMAGRAARARRPPAAGSEIKLVASGGNRDVEIAYDTTASRSSLTLP